MNLVLSDVISIREPENDDQGIVFEEVADQENFLTTSDNEEDEDEVLKSNNTISSHDDPDDDDKDIRFSAVTKRNEQDLLTRMKAKPADARNINVMQSADKTKVRI